MKKIYKEYLHFIKENPELCKKAAKELMSYLRSSSVSYHGRCVYTLLIPKIFTKTDIERFEHITKVTYGIFEKIINAFLQEPQYRNCFPFSGELKELILTERGYPSPLPIARFDIFYNEDNGDFKFCEINTDGTSAMNEDYVLNQAYALNPAHESITKEHRLQAWELYDSWVSEFADIYASYDNKVEHPYIAIADFLATGSVTEFEEFKCRFEKAGYECEVCEISQMSYDGKRLYSPKGRAVDVVYRRAVTSDVIRRIDEVRPFVNAVKDGNVCIIGAFCTQIIHNKWLFKTLHEEATLALLTEEEQAFVKKHVPYTNLLTAEACKAHDLIADKDRWLIKPLDSYASRGVFAGCGCTPDEWEAHINAAFGNDYIFQEYCPPYLTKNVSYLNDNDRISDYSNMSGLFVYNGKFKGVYSRLSTGEIISSQYNERAVPSFMLL